MAETVPWSVLGLAVVGDIADTTIYTDRYGKKIAFQKSPPKEPPSPAQINQRNRFRLAQRAWMELSDESASDWERLVQAASLVMTGQNLYISVALRGNLTTLATLERQTGITVVKPPIFV